MCIRDSFQTVDYWVYTDDLEEDISLATVHVASLGDASPIFNNLSLTTEDKILTGTLSNPNIPAFFAGRLIAGNAQVNIATEDFPEGKIRGQLYRVARDGRLFTFCNNQFATDVNTDADGGGIIAIDRKISHSHLLLANHNLSSNLESLTVNSGQIGETGTELLDLTEQVNDGFVNWFWHESTTTVPFNEAVADDIKASNAFLRLDTEDNPEGELRGQVLSQLNCVNRFNESADLELELALSRAHYAQFDSLGLCFTIANRGAVTAENVIVDVPVPNGFVYCFDVAEQGEYDLFHQQWNVGTLEPGESVKLNMLTLAMSSGNNINYFTEVSNSSAFDHDSTPNNQNFNDLEDDEVGTTILAVENGGSGTGDFDVDLEVNLTADQMSVGQYKNVNYTITVSNTGSDFASNVLMNVKIPPGLAYVSDSFSMGNLTLHNGRWFISELAPGQTATLNLELFTLWPSSTIPYFVQVHSVDQPDNDSTPGNVFNFIVSEDDEARVDITTTAQGAAPTNTPVSFASLVKDEIYPNPAFDQIKFVVQSGIDTCLLYTSPSPRDRG